MGQLSYSISLPASFSSDVITREIHIITNGIERTVKISPEFGTYSVMGKHGDQLSVFVIDIDDAGNRSNPSESLDWLVVDTIAPKTPIKPVLLSVEEIEEVLEELIVEEHEHCTGVACQMQHEHCLNHEHCKPPCNLNHEHCGNDCFSCDCLK